MQQRFLTQRDKFFSGALQQVVVGGGKADGKGDLEAQPLMPKTSPTPPS